MTSRDPHKVELLGRRLRKLRKERKLSPAQLAERAGIDVQDLARIERGEIRVGLEVLLGLLSVFKVEPGDLERLLEDERSTHDDRERFRRDLSG
jgi:transcriptional regulator with XRE-family HTH domain